MKLTRTLLMVAVTVVTRTPTVFADEWNKRTIVTFSGPVEIPGTVLSAGTYVFKLADSSSDRHIVQIFDRDEKKLYGTLLAIPDWRTNPSDKTVVTFEERAAGAPEAIKEWFYPGDNFGQMFVYPKSRATTLAQTARQPVPSMADSAVAQTVQQPSAPPPTELQIRRMSEIPLKAATPQAEEVEVAEVFQQRPTELPTTATNTAAFGVLGFALVGMALAVRANGHR